MRWFPLTPPSFRSRSKTLMHHLILRFSFTGYRYICFKKNDYWGELCFWYKLAAGLFSGRKKNSACNVEEEEETRLFPLTVLYEGTTAVRFSSVISHFTLCLCFWFFFVPSSSFLSHPVHREWCSDCHVIPSEHNCRCLPLAGFPLKEHGFPGWRGAAAPLYFTPQLPVAPPRPPPPLP